MDFDVANKDYSVAEFFDNFGHSLPKIVMVSQGFCGEILEDTFDRDQLIRLQTISRQKRVVAKTEHANHKKLLSIPLTYPEHLCVIGKHSKHVSKEKPISQIVTENTLPCAVQFPRDKTICVGNQKVSTNHIPKMVLSELFDEVYMLGNFIMDGVMSREVVHVPLYLSQLRLVEVTGIKGASADKWKSYQSELDLAASYLQYNLEFGNPGIAVYDPKAIHTDTQYAYVEPTLYSNVLTLVHSHGHKTHEDTVHNPIYPTDSEYQEIGMPRESPPQGAPKKSVDITRPTQAKTAGANQSTSQFKQELNNAVKKAPKPTGAPEVGTATSVFPRYTVQMPEVAPKPKYRNPPPLPDSVTDPKDFKLPSRQPLQKPLMESSNKAVEENHYSNDVPRSAIPPTPIATKPVKQQPPPKEHVKERLSQIREVHSADDVALLTIGEVTEYMKLLKLDDYIDSFKEQMVDGNMLLALDKDILKEEFHMKGIEALRLIKFANEGHIPS